MHELTLFIHKRTPSWDKICKCQKEEILVLFVQDHRHAGNQEI